MTSDPPGVVVRAAAAADIPGILGLWREADAVPTSTDDPGSLARLIAHDPGAVLVAETIVGSDVRSEDSRLVGSVIAGWDGWRGSIYRLAVVPSHRRQGLARLLLDRAEDRLRQVGAVRLQAVVVETDLLARAFWGASGWEQQPERLRFVKS